MVLPRVLAVLAVVALSACTTQVGGEPVAGTTLPPEPEELTAEYVFDDLTTVDPCSLTDPGVFDSFGAAEFGTPESLDYCAISVDVAGAEVIMAVGAFGELAALPELEGRRVKDVEGGLWIGQQDDSPSFCARLLVFPDGVTMQVEGSVYTGEANTCPLVEAGMDHAVEVVLDRAVEHRSPAPNSLVTIDPCALVDDARMGAAFGMVMNRPSDYPGKHTCFWDNGAGVTVRLQFGAGPKPAANGEGANEDPVAGRPSATNPFPDVGDASYCAVATAHIPFTGVPGMADMFEVASVFVRMPAGRVADGCRAAQLVATMVWPGLPEA